MSTTTSRERTAPTAAGKLLAVLGAFDGTHRRLTLTGLAERSGLALTTTHRIAAELTAWGALERRRDDTYVVGRRLWELGLLAPVQSELRVVAAPFLHDLHAATKATVHLAVLDGARALYVDRVSGRWSVPIVSDVGSRLPLHTTGVGKVLLAHAPADVVQHCCVDLVAPTRWTVTDSEVLTAQLARVREQGWAVTDQEMTPGAASLAVPVREAGTGVVAALGVVLAPFEVGSPVQQSLLAALRVTAAGIERCLPRGG
ncbi:IclR family transcriptional regulator [Kineococcus auxinigenes]|uniref:IclR family transcriptional regulator n=1 Tax=unclassified Kineococcus TaxID=2621656 RepID=UPI003D7D7373